MNLCCSILSDPNFDTSIGTSIAQDGKLSLKEFGTLLSSLGQNPTEQELQDTWQDLARPGRGNLQMSFSFGVFF